MSFLFILGQSWIPYNWILKSIITDIKDGNPPKKSADFVYRILFRVYALQIRFRILQILKDTHFGLICGFTCGFADFNLLKFIITLKQYALNTKHG